MKVQKLEEIKCDGVTVAILMRESSCQPFVVAWSYNDTTESWCQGHYFETLVGAVDYFNQTYVEQTREQLLEIMTNDIELLLDYTEDEIMTASFKTIKEYAEKYL